MAMNIVWVGLGGMLGSIGRYLAGVGVARLFPAAWMSVGTLAVNVVGCFALGGLATWIAHQRDAPAWCGPFLIIGVLGGFTTFSTFGVEAFDLLRGEHPHRGLVQVASHILLGLGAVWLGVFTVQRWGLQ